MNIQQRYRQAAKEARWALALTILYVIGWCLCAYLPKGTIGPIGFPLWFELSCIYLPILFVIIAYWVVQIVYQEIDLETNSSLEDKKTGEMPR
ncbi:YhdT family protein [Mannheimia massilioguelmaensis]|uniref:YhdT family protein n=1 Tax=Mannheimia massilioguelmaensis TaxID=1604354 RepID=UPI0005C901E8|nr:DUF997 family protein [Mannheimia massilioguelmaensis]